MLCRRLFKRNKQGHKVHIKVFGRVQGVGYRYFVERYATKLNISGWVRNCADGAVEIMAEGDSKDLDTFLDYCKKGPMFGVVSKIEPVAYAEYAAPPVTEGEFRILASV